MSKRSLADTLEKWLNDQVLRQDADALKPLPATRALGEQFGISHGTVFRLLRRMEADGKVWRHANGRFYPALAGKVLGRSKPLAVMLRRMQAWSWLCREVMEGFTEECGERDRPMLWFHNKDLVFQEAPDSDRIASSRAQKTMLEEFVLFHGDSIGGVLFDEVWRDEAIEGVFPPGVSMVSFARPSTLPTLGSVSADLNAGVLLAISHLLACGYEKIFLIDPLPEYGPGQFFLETGRMIYRQLFGRDLPSNQVATLHTAAQCRDFMRRLAGSKTRSGLICPEDNLSLSLVRMMREGGIPLGKQHGLISVMGTSALKPGEVTCVRYDFRAMGQAAAEMLCESSTEKRVLPPSLDVGASTQ